jgi:hypothetical protein
VKDLKNMAYAKNVINQMLDTADAKLVVQVSIKKLANLLKNTKKKRIA